MAKHISNVFEIRPQLPELTRQRGDDFGRHWLRDIERPTRDFRKADLQGRGTRFFVPTNLNSIVHEPISTVSQIPKAGEAIIERKLYLRRQAGNVLQIFQWIRR